MFKNNTFAPVYPSHMKTSISRALPYIVALAAFFVITLIFFSPMLEGKRLKQSDIMNFRGAAQEIKDFREKTGDEPLWTNAMFGGMPAYQISVKYTGNLIRYVDRILQFGLPAPAGFLLLSFIGFFILLLVLKVDPWLALAGSIAFGLSSYFLIILEAGHNSKAHAIAYMAPVIAGILLTFRGKYLLGGALSTLFIALELKVNHPQITYYLLMMVLVLGVFLLVQAITEKTLPSFLKSTAVLIVAALLAGLTGITSLWATYEYGKYTIRGATELSSEKENRTTGLDKDYITQWSYGIDESLSLLIPNIKGGSSMQPLSENSATYKAIIGQGIPRDQARQFTQAAPTYWGNQPFTSGPVYVGAIIIFLFNTGLIILKGKLKWWLLVVTILSLLLSWGHNFMWFTDLFLTYLPGYNKFRAVSMILVIAEVAMPILALLTLQYILSHQDEKERIFRGMKISFYITGAICLVLALFPSMFFDFRSLSDNPDRLPDWLISALMEDRVRILRIDAARSLVFIVLSGVVLWLYLYKGMKKSYLIPALILLVFIDMLPVAKRYMSNKDFERKSKMAQPFTPSRADLMILEDPDPNFRVYNLTVDPFNDASTSYFHKSIGGYHGAKLRRYQEMIEHHLTKNNFRVLNMLNTKYYIIPDQNTREPFAQRNPQALGNVWFVDSVRVVKDADAEIAALNDFNPATTAVIDQRFEKDIAGFSAGKDSLANIRLLSYKPNHLTYSSTSTKPGLAVFSEIYYDKGWNAYVDGQLQPHFRVNYVLRGMIIPAGSHQVEFRFEPVVYRQGERISLASSILLLLLFAGAAFVEIRNRNKASAE